MAKRKANKAKNDKGNASAPKTKRKIKTGMTPERAAEVAAHDAIYALEIDDFAGLIGETFEARSCTVTDELIDTLHPLALELVAVDRGPPTPDEHRDQFSLLFVTEDGIPHEGGIFKVQHKKIGAHRLLVHEIQPPLDNPPGKRYVEICFG